LRPDDDATVGGAECEQRLAGELRPPIGVRRRSGEEVLPRQGLCSI
jgi:hypothetical protein